MQYMKLDGLLVRKQMSYKTHLETTDEIWTWVNIRQDWEPTIHTLSCDQVPYFQSSHFQELQIEIFSIKVSGCMQLKF